MKPITTENDFRKACKIAVFNYYLKYLATRIEPNDIYVVWQVKALQNFKALLSTNISDTRYFEITYNGDKNEMYLDAYTKEQNICLN
jgi:hypothetical protein